MRKIELNASAFMASPDDKKFIVLGSEKAHDLSFFQEHVIPKVFRDRKNVVPGIWGTLGFANDEKIDWNGHLEISSEGNDFSKGVVRQEIDLIRECYPHLRLKKDKIIERFISFEHMDIQYPEMFTINDLPKIRLELFLEPDEGAIVFYQSEKENDDDVAIEYIQPKATKGNKVHDRDRLSYIFETIPQYELDAVPFMPGYYKLSTTKEYKTFLVKILTFKRTHGLFAKNKNVDSKDVILQAKQSIFQLVHKKKIYKEHRILIYSRKKNQFIEAKPKQIKTDLKTLFLIHGTFASTQGSFGDLYGKEGNWFEELTNPNAEKHYKQIIAFDHPTLFYGAEENIQVLNHMLGELGVDSFKEDVDFIGTSQGGLLVQYLANHTSKYFKVGKAALVASANGVGYLTAGQYVSKFLSILKYFFKVTGMQAQSLVTALAQHSADFLLEQPGLQIMTPGNAKLDAIMNSTPVSPHTRYLPIISDYDESIIDEDDSGRILKFIKRMGARGVDTVAKAMLGTDNDWVVGTKNQFIVPFDYSAIPNYNPAKYRDEMLVAIHGTSLRQKEARERIEDFFFDELLHEKSVAINSDYFDAHCHIFGREILTGRIIYLLMQDLLSYKAAKNSPDKLPVIEGLGDEMVDHKVGTGSVAKNILKYFAMNKTSMKVLDDLETEYHLLNSNVYKYTPLMFDLEMTFRNKYYEDTSGDSITDTNKNFLSLLNEYIDDVDDLIKRFEKGNELVFNGSLIQNEESIKVLKFIKKAVKVLDVLTPDLEKNTKTGYQKQFDELIILKKRYGSNIFPFLAVDPRREGMAKLIKDNIGLDKTFHGVKIYAPNGYSPTDPNLFDDSKQFIDGKSLYSWCIENNIPIMAHCSNAGFSTFTAKLEVWGDICENESVVHMNEPTEITFRNTISEGGFALAVRERAETLNHPRLWKIVLDTYPELKLCLAHFGGESKKWRDEIASLLRDNTYKNLFTDLSCMVDQERLETIYSEFFESKDPIADKIMYGSDFYLNMLNNITFNEYYTHFRKVFTDAELRKLSLDVPKKYLGL